ncbi:MAG: UV DNA damage repair endonuclease UvsE [Bacilli bacterium]|nr:UV DNA damage repair endonuclease UvsE [Bacilli bacterium]
MIIRLGYVGMSKTLSNITPSSTYTYTNFIKNNDYNKLNEVIISNLEALNNLIDYNIKNNVHFFRLTSKLIPLATKKEVQFDYINKYKKYYDEISDKIIKNNMRIDFHPDQFTILNSTKKEVVEDSIEILKYHYNILDALKIKNKIIILHVGSSVLGKENAIKRFINNFKKLPDYLKDSIVIENDDKIFNIDDCLKINKEINIPIVLDYHHHICNNENDIINHIEDVFNTWESINPKIHFSTSKSKLKKEIRSHHEYINSDDFIFFLEKIKHLNYDVDIMIEAKGKDDAVFRLIRELKYKTN